ncbi:MAG: methyltransferase domain-containing protein [Bacteroidota bacterium]
MASTIHYNTCPICASSSIGKLYVAKDYTVSGELFEVWRCNSCSVGFTQDVPDASTIGPYYAAESYVSHTDSSKGFINSVYHKVRSYALLTKKNLVTTLVGKKTGAILDIGAGTGAFAHTMLTAGWQVTGLEPDATAAKQALLKYNIQLAAADTIYTLEHHQFDAITMWHVIEHVHDLYGYFKRFFEILKTDGVLVIAVPNYTSTDASIYGKNWAALDTPRHLYHFSPASMELIADTHGFKLVIKKAMWFDAFYVAMLTEQHNGGSFIKAILVGLWSNVTALLDVNKCSSVIYTFKKK